MLTSRSVGLPCARQPQERTVFSLAHLTVIGLPPPDMIRVAACTGYDCVGLRLIKVTPSTPGYSLMTDQPMMRATKAAMAETGLHVLDIELVRITPEIDVGALEPVLAAGAELGARHVITVPMMEMTATEGAEAIARRVRQAAARLLEAS